jgi:hypothetical protein
MKSLKHKQFCLQLRPVVCADGRFYTHVANVRKLELEYKGGMGARKNHFVFEGESSEFPENALISEEQLTEKLAAIRDDDRKTVAQVIAKGGSPEAAAAAIGVDVPSVEALLGEQAEEGE